MIWNPSHLGLSLAGSPLFFNASLKMWYIMVWSWKEIEDMKNLLIPLSLILIFVQLPFGPQPPEKPEEEKSPVKGGKLISYFGAPPTQYSKAGKGIIKAESLGGRTSLFKEVGEKEKSFSRLSW